MPAISSALTRDKRKRTRAASLQERGEASRQRLIDAALEIFGEFGFDGSSTRMLADKAGANLAAIPYHFGSKEGLYRAAAEYIVERITDQTTGMLQEIEHALLNAPLPRATAPGAHPFVFRISRSIRRR
jgi:AcrR family transcriptional regulator